MGCVSSKLIKKELQREILCGVDGQLLYPIPFPNHVVSLTSTTYGALNLDKSDSPKQQQHKAVSDEEEEEEEEEEQAEVINAWELMGDLEEETIPVSVRGKKSPKTVIGRSPFKRLNKADTPKNAKKLLTMGKENRGAHPCNTSVAGKGTYFTPQRERERERERGSKSCDFLVTSSSRRRKSLSPLFDPELVEAYEKELCQEQEQEEQIKKIISESPGSLNSSARFDCRLDGFEKKCPPGGEDSVVVYTTTLRGIRKTFEECNTVRSILESHQIRMYERDVSMDSGFKEELRKLMGANEELRIPVVFVKGRLIGGADEISRLEEEAKLGSLLDRIPRNSSPVCQGCGGVRFIMCVGCSGSCKVLDEEHKSTVRCGECNENGLIHCPLCC